MGKMIHMKMSDGADIAVYQAEAVGERRGGLVLVQEIFGVTDHIRELCDEYAADGYDVLSPAIFDREHPGFEADYNGPDYNRATVEIAAEMSAPAVDIYTYFKDSEGFFVDESHFEDSGHRITAEIIARRILPLVGKHWAQNGGTPASLASR